MGFLQYLNGQPKPRRYRYADDGATTAQDYDTLTSADTPPQDYFARPPQRFDPMGENTNSTAVGSNQPKREAIEAIGGLTAPNIPAPSFGVPPPASRPAIEQITTGRTDTNLGQPEAAPVEPSPAIAVNPATRRQQAEQGVYDIQNKDYGFKKDAEGNVMLDADGKKMYGKDRDKDHNWWDVVKSGGLGLLQGLMAGGIGGGIGGLVTGAIRGGVDRNADEKMIDQMVRLPQARQKLAQARDSEQYDTKQRKSEAEINEIQRRPEKEQAARQQQFNLEAQKQIGRIQVLQAKEAAEGKKWKQISRNGKYFKQYADHEEPLINQATGQQEADLLEMPIETTSENGTKGYAKFGTILNADATKSYRDAMLALGQDRLAQQDKQFQQTYKLNVEQFQEAKQHYADVLKSRQQSFDAMMKAQQNKDEDGYGKFKLELDKYDKTLQDMLTDADKAYSRGELDDSQLQDIKDFVKSKRGN